MWARSALSFSVDKDVDMPVVVRSCSSSIMSSRLCLATETGTHSETVQPSAAMGGVFWTAEG